MLLRLWSGGGGGGPRIRKDGLSQLQCFVCDSHKKTNEIVPFLLLQISTRQIPLDIWITRRCSLIISLGR